MLKHFALLGSICSRRSSHRGLSCERRVPRILRQPSVVFALMLITLLVNTASLPAVLISTGSGDASSDASVGIASYGSTVYLGNGWVITAGHVGSQDIQFGSTTYTPVGGTYHTITLNGDLADIVLYQVQHSGTYPNVPAVPLTTSAPQIGDQVTAIGYGQGANQPQLYFSSDAAYGYDLDGQQSVHQLTGTGLLANASVVANPSGVTGPVLLSNTSWNSTDVFSTYANQSNSFLLTPGDSGGALLNSSGQLMGILEAVYQYGDQTMPPTTGIFGEVSAAVSLYSYVGLINPIIVPEPASCLLVGSAALALVVLARGRRRTTSTAA